jgi:hypothetical protein
MLSQAQKSCSAGISGKIKESSTVKLSGVHAPTGDPTPNSSVATTMTPVA